jgi:hypothetical protein
LKKLKNHPGRIFGDFGAGIGTVCEIVHTFCDKMVTHIDIPSRAMDFAYWRNRKYNWNITIHPIADTQFRLAQRFDILFTDAVWEHLTPITQLGYAWCLPHYLNKDGWLIFLVDLAGPSEEMPMHYPVNITAVHDAIESTGFMVCDYGRNHFASVWRRTS